ncbi:Outer membrane efflux protein [Maioricimonas rarisocia]|uniref:Outer membrane efflux protein n=1 Tax=Maioricimonas rarisocia TaxID=2528026 RepID=A0A517Z528_9PLAN|nr:TolC family protein [Maioricimonas rarisocia]QDU37553.1 Outer membrane efflux protein [Maioricimonas rarisocia]
MRHCSLLLTIALGIGCATTRSDTASSSATAPAPVVAGADAANDRDAVSADDLPPDSAPEADIRLADVRAADDPSLQPVSNEDLSAAEGSAVDGSAVNGAEEAEPDIDAEPEPIVPVAPGYTTDHGLGLDDVIGSVYQSYPLLEAALQSRNIAAGEQMAATGAFDLKFKAASENGPTGFYHTYRQSVGVVQPTYHGGEVFAGYRIGRGSFQPWYKERQTNDGGEFKAGVVMPLSRNRHIDGRRAELWRTTYGRQLAEPDIQAQLIGFVQEASYAYWDWVAAGEKFRIAERVLALAEDRTMRIRRQVEEGFLDPPELTDNLRLVAERRAKRADAARKLQQTAVKLSLYLRGIDGHPQIPAPEDLPTFPNPEPVDEADLLFDSQLALEQRPEIAVYNFAQRQLEVDLAEAHNEMRPSVDAVVSASQDVGFPASKKNDKGHFELDASIFVDVPIQRRKARGKMQAVQAKIAQLNAKRRLTEDKIVADVQSAYAALVSAYEQVQQARQAVEYAEDLAARERRNLELGASDLLKVTLREQYAVESAEKAVDALQLYFQARADYRAALAQDRLP